MEKHIDSLNEQLFSSLNKGYSLGLSHGKTGICLYLFYLSRELQKPVYQEMAEELLDGILADLSLEMPIQVEDGLSGIGLALTWLVKEKFIEGDLNEMLEQLDHVIYRKLLFEQYNAGLSIAELLHLIFYLYIRFKEQTDEDEKYLFEQLIIKTINLVQTRITPKFFDEPVPFSIYDYHLPLFLWITGKLLENNIYRDRIEKIVKETEAFVLTKIPLLQINRLTLLWGMSTVTPHLNSVAWEKHTQLLYEKTDISEMLEKEIKNKNIFISNGLSLIPLITSYLEKHTPQYKVECDYRQLYERILHSEAWSSLRDKDYYYNIHRTLLNGFPGVYLIAIYLKKHYV